MATEYKLVVNGGADGEIFKTVSDNAALSKAINLALSRNGNASFVLFRVEPVVDELLARIEKVEKDLVIRAVNL
jgi:hypothetical protein